MLPNTEGDDGEIDGDEEQRLIQSEINGGPQVQHSVSNLGGKVGIILLRPSGSSATALANTTFPGKGAA